MRTIFRLFRILTYMNIYFSGIGGVAIGPLCEIALDAGYSVQGSDKAASMVTERLKARGIPIEIGSQDGAFLRDRHQKQPIDWFIHTSALPSDHPELLAAKNLGIKAAKRDELLAGLISDKNLKLIAVAGTHGKTTTTGMIVWLAKYFGIPVSYSVGTTLSWGPSGRYSPGSEYFVYECDEFDRNFLHFRPFVSLITSLDYDHPDTYPTKQSYQEAFRQFAGQSEQVFTWRGYEDVFGQQEHVHYLDEPFPSIRLHGEHNRRNGSLILAALERFKLPAKYAVDGLNKFPGTDRRFEKLAKNLYSDYAHTPAEIAATLQMAREISEHVVVVYQPHQNTRQHHIKNEYKDAFEGAEKVYWLPTYLSREDTKLKVLTPEEITSGITDRHNITHFDLGDELYDAITADRKKGSLVLVMGAGNIDSWIKKKVSSDR